MRLDMKINYIILLVILLNFGLVSGQSTTSSPTNNNVALPNFTPPSPHSFEMTKYGDIPVNEFTGMINANIPIYEYKAGNLSLPIFLEYSGGGVKVDQSCTWTGINWVLRSGGVITRTINDLADELYGQSNRIVLNNIPANSGEDGTAAANNIVNIIENPMFDSEADIFSFNFNGYSGSFFLDNNFQPTLVKNDSELKITIVGTLLNNQEFIITTPDGVKYYFGGADAIETEVGTSENPCSSCGVATAYYLTKIEHPVNGTILFGYDAGVGAINTIAKSRNYGIMTYTTQTNYDCSPPPPASEKTEEIVVTTRQGGSKYLNKIYSPNTPSYVDFISENKNLGNSHKILNKINIQNGSSIIKEVDFEYLGSDQSSSFSKRFFLSKVSINKNIAIINGLQNKFEEYSLVYDDLEGLPDRLSYAQDYYGYYNGEEDNISSLPQLNINTFNNSNYNYLAANRKPNFQYAKKGTLKKIIYPTKGFTEFEYEGIPVKEKVYTHYTGNAILNTTGADLTNNHVPRYDVDFEHWYNLDPIFEDQLVNIEVVLSRDSICALPNHNLKTRLIIEDLSSQSSQTNVTTFDQQIGYQGGTAIFPFTFLKNKSYRVSVIFLNTTSNCTSSPLNVRFNFDLFTSYRVVDGKGVRVKRVIDKTAPDVVATVKRYYYVPVNKVNTYLNPENVPFESIPRLLTYGMSNYRGKHKSSENPDATCVVNFWTDQAYYTYINSNAVQNSFSATDGTAYPFVTISYGGDDFENGGTQKIYNKIVSDIGNKLSPLTAPQYPTDISTNRFYNKLNNENVISGDLVQQIDFEKRGTRYYKKKQKDYDYENINQIVNKSYVNVVGRKVFEVLEFYGVNDPMMISSNYYIKAYLTKSFNTKLNSITESDYFSQCEMPDYDYDFYGLEQELTFNFSDYPDPNNVKKVITTQSNTYGTLRGLPIETTVTTSDNARILKTKNYYPTDASSLSGLTSGQIHDYTALVNQNCIGTPIQVQKYENNDLLSTQRILYKSWNNNTQILPEIIQTTKGNNPLEDRVVFSEYDVKGNPTVVSLKDGTKTKYFYNNLNQVVAKVENYSTALNMSASPNLSNACAFITQYPQAVISVYNYDAVTNQIVSIVAPNCKTMYYVYDALHQLQAIKDNDGNIVQEFEHNYKPQN